MNMRSEESQSNWRDTHSDSQWCKRALLRRTPKDRPSSQEGPGENEQRSCRSDHRDLLATPANQRKIPLTDGPRQSDGHLSRLDEGPTGVGAPRFRQVAVPSGSYRSADAGNEIEVGADLLAIAKALPAPQLSD